MSHTGPLREVLDDVRTELWLRRAQVLAALTYVVIGFGAIYLMSSVGEDSGALWDSVDRTTLAAIGVGSLAVGVALGGVTLAVDRDVRRRQVPGAPPRYVRRRKRVVVAMLVGTVLIAAGLSALSRWS